MGRLGKIGLLGGTFDPIHNAHIEIALVAKQRFNLDEVHFIVAKEPPIKEHVVLDAERRFKLALKALEPYEGFVASRIELDRVGKSYSYLTVQDYRQQFPDAELFWIMGKDAFIGLPEWKEFDYLKDNLSFIVFSREINNLQVRDDRDQLTGINFFVIDDVNFQISSSDIKASLDQKMSLDQELPRNIRELIVEYYGKD